jgi:hypothetical protein
VPRPLIMLLPVAVAALAVTPPALAKDRVTATIDAPTACDAAAGTRITISWSLATATHEPFGASGIFVRLRRFGGRPAVRKAARADRRGHYTVRVKVPRGGIRRIDVGLEGTRTTGGVTSDADVFFRVVNDPCRAPR